VSASTGVKMKWISAMSKLHIRSVYDLKQAWIKQMISFNIKQLRIHLTGWGIWSPKKVFFSLNTPLQLTNIPGPYIC
jgi:hypothetical protein